MRKGIFHAALSTVFVLLVTIDNATDAFWGEQMWITFRDGPGGPSLFFLAEQSVWYQVFGTTSALCMILLGDALLVCHSRSLSTASNTMEHIARSSIDYLSSMDQATP